MAICLRSLCRITAFVLVIILSVSLLPCSSGSSETASEVCVFGRDDHCPFHCHCDAPFSAVCDSLTGACPLKKCAQFAGDSGSGGTYSPWHEPGCQLGNVGLEKMLSVKRSGFTVQMHTVESPYGSTVPLLCLYQDSGAKLDSLEFILDLESQVHLNLLQVRSRHDTRVLFDAYHSGTCDLSGFVLDNEIDDKTNATRCASRYPSYDESVMFVCNKKGRYFVLTASGCNLGDLNLTNICIEAIEAFGYPAVNIECSRCMENNNSVLTANVQSYLRQLNTILENSIEANNTMDISSFTDDNCGNGIWCEVCQPGWMPPDCQHQCPYGRFGMNCLFACKTELVIPNWYHCRDQRTRACDPVTGEFVQCSDGCELWYAGGNLCTDHVGYFDYEVTLSNITVGSSYVAFSFGSESRIPRNLSQYYVYQVDYTLDQDTSGVYLLYPHLLAHDSDQATYFANITNLPEAAGSETTTATTAGIRIRLGRKQGNVVETFPSNTTQYFTTSCVGKPDVRAEGLALHVRWNSSIMHPQCGTIYVTGIHIRDVGMDEFITFNIADATEIRVPDLDAGTYTVHLEGYNPDGYRVIGGSVQVEVIDNVIVEISTTPTRETVDEGDTDDVSNKWLFNTLGIVFLVLLIASLVVVAVVTVCIIVVKRTRNTSKSDDQSDDRPLSNISHTTEGVRRYVRDPSVSHSSQSPTIFDNNFDQERDFLSGKRQRKDTETALYQPNRPRTELLQQDVGESEPFYHQISEMDKRATRMMSSGEENGGYMKAVGESFNNAQGSGNNNHSYSTNLGPPAEHAPRPSIPIPDPRGRLDGGKGRTDDVKVVGKAPPQGQEGDDEEALYCGRNTSSSTKSDSNQPVFL